MRAAGFGFRSSATMASLTDALQRAGGRVDLVATAESKAAAPVFRAFAQGLGLAVQGIAAEHLAGMTTLTHSPGVAGRFGVGSLAEAAALAAAGPGARLVGPRVVSADGLATAAIAERMDG